MRIFGTAGIRLKYPDQLDPILAYKLGLITGDLGLSDKTFIVYDSRITNHVLTYAFASGVMASGVDTYIIGLAPTPISAYAARKYRGVGVSVTASHNPPEYNGFKFYDIEGYEFTRVLEKVIEDKLDGVVNPKPWSSAGKLYVRNDIIDEYIDDLLARIGGFKQAWNPFIIVDLANGAAGVVSPEIIKRLGGRPLTINANPDGFFPVRAPEPRRDVLETYLELYRSVKPAVILAHDGDADRLAVLDPFKGFIRQDRLIAFYAKIFLEEGRKGRIIVSVDTGKCIDDIAEKYGIHVERYVLGKTHERVKELGSSNILLAAEPWKLIDPYWGPWVDGLWQSALITREIVRTGRSFYRILEEMNIPDYPWDRRSYLLEPVEIRDKVYSVLIEDLKHILGEPFNVIDIDGYRYEYSDNSWVLIRKSGTEPKIRLYMEANSVDRLKFMVETVEKRLKNVVRDLNGRVVEVTIG